MKNFTKLSLVIISFISMAFTTGSSVSAAENPGNYSVQPELPANQKKNVEGYFDLLVTPNQQQTLYVNLTNSASTKETFDLSINPAVTTDGGTIDYAQKKPQLDKTLPFDIRDYVKLSQSSYTLNANSSVRVPINIKLGAKTFNGRVIGGLSITKKGAGSASNTNKNGVSIKNKIGYSIAIVLQQSEDKVTPDLKLLSGKPAQVNSYTNIQLHFRNPTATIIPDLIFTTKVYKDGKLYLENTSNKYLVAPNTNFHLNLGLDGNRIEPGSYKAEIVAKSGPFYTWRFSTVFTVDQEAADEVNKNAIFKNEEPNWWMIIAFVVIGLLLLLILIFLIIFWKRRKKDDEENKTENQQTPRNEG